MGNFRSIAVMLFLKLVGYTYYAFIVVALLTSLLGGISDTVQYSRCVEAQDEWASEAADEGEEFAMMDYTPNLLTGLANFLMFSCAVILSLLFLRNRHTAATFLLFMATTALSAFIMLLPRAPIGTGTSGMQEVFAFLTVLGIIDTVLFRYFFMKKEKNDP